MIFCSKRIFASGASSTRLAALSLSFLLSFGFAGAEPLKRDDAGAHYCAAVFVLAINKSKNAMLHSKDAEHERDIQRMTVVLAEASRYFSDRRDLATAESVESNPDFFRGEMDVKACESARRSADVKGCLVKCGAGKSSGACVDQCFEAGSDVCKRTMSCGPLFAAKADTQPWTVFAPAGAGYRISFPGQPEIAARPGAAILKQGFLNFIASYADIPFGTQATAETLRQESLRAVGAGKGAVVLRTETDLKVSGMPAKEFVLDEKNNVRVSRHVLAGVRVVSAIYMGPRGTEQSPDVRRFFDSLEIVSK